MSKISCVYENRGFLTLMVGPSGAGKSTFIREWTSNLGRPLPSGELNPFCIEHFTRGTYPPLILSTDDIRKELTGDPSNQRDNKQVFVILELRAAAGLAAGRHVIVDATNLYRSSRRIFFNLADFERTQYIVLDRKNKIPWHGNMDVVIRHDHIFQQELPDILAGDHFPSVRVIDLRFQFDD